MMSKFFVNFRFVREFSDLQLNLKNQLELKDEVEKLKEFMLKSYIL
jgi:hypothetical protein